MIKSNPIILREAEAVIDETGQATVQFSDLDIEAERFTGLSIEVIPDSTYRHKYTVVQAISVVSDEAFEEYQRNVARAMAEQLEEVADDDEI